MDAVKAKQQIATRARTSGRARISAPRSRVKHVEVLGRNQGVSASDPPGPRPLPADHHPARLTPTECPKSRSSNGGTEAVNGLIELARRIARGFTNYDNYRLRMLLIAGGLDPLTPT